MTYNLLQSQEDLFVQWGISSAVGGSNSVITKIYGKETLSELFEYRVDFQAKEISKKPDDILGSSVSIVINEKDKPRFIHGIIAHFSENAVQANDDDQISNYSLIIKPNFWLLTLDKDCKIFQNQTIINIIKQVLKDEGVKDVSDKTSKCGKTKLEYCVQYNESSFDFVSRLMEDAGIFYYFTHEKSKHTLVLADSANSCKKISNQSDVEYLIGANSDIPLNRIYSARIEAQVNSGEYAMADYNYQKSKTKLMSKLKAKWKGKRVYEYPGGFLTASDGDNISKIRVQEMEFNHSLFCGASTVTTFNAGASFEFKHESSKFNGTYVLYSCETFYDYKENGQMSFHNEFKSFKNDVEFRPLRRTQKPFISTQTAKVVCPKGKEMYRNEFAAIKVQFYWDQYNKETEPDKCSCWIRVAQSVAGSAWGVLQIPRIGQEVIVSFINGNPDQPIITGTVYNDQNKTPYPDPEISTIKSVTFEKDKEFNEFRLTDKADKQEIYTHAAKDMNTEIVNQRKTTINKADDILEIQEGSKSTTLLAKGDNPGNYTLELTKGNKTETLKEGNFIFQDDKGDMSIVLKKGNFSQQLDQGNITINVKKGNIDIDIKGDYTVNLSGNAKIKADKDISLEGANIELKASKEVKIQSGSAMTIKAGSEAKIQSGTAMTVKAGTAMTQQSGTNFAVKAGTEMKITANTNFAVKANVNAEIKANVNANIAATVAAALKGTVNAEVSGAVVKVSGQGAVQISAPMTAAGKVLQLG